MDVSFLLGWIIVFFGGCLGLRIWKGNWFDG